MNITGFSSIGGTPYVYLQDSNNASIAMGLDSAASNVFKISVSTAAGVLPTTSPQLLIDPSANGHITLTPNGSGLVTISYMTAGLVHSDGSGNLTSGGSTGLETITGNTGGAISPTAGNINIITANATVKFAGSGSTETLDFGLGNLALGSSLPSLTTGLANTAFGFQALNSTISASDSTAIGYQSLLNLTATDVSNTAVGAASLFTLIGSGNGFNTAVGSGVGFFLETGSYNSLFGVSAGQNYTTSESSNICINSFGVVGESNTLRIGRVTGAGNLTLQAAYICGIDGVNVGSVAKVVTMASDQLGTATITGGTNISIGTGANTITINATGPAAFNWITTMGGTASANTGYFTSNGASLV